VLVRRPGPHHVWFVRIRVLRLCINPASCLGRAKQHDVRPSDDQWLSAVFPVAYGSVFARPSIPGQHVRNSHPVRRSRVFHHGADKLHAVSGRCTIISVPANMQVKSFFRRPAASASFRSHPCAPPPASLAHCFRSSQERLLRIFRVGTFLSAESLVTTAIKSPANCHRQSIFNTRISLLRNSAMTQGCRPLWKKVHPLPLAKQSFHLCDLVDALFANSARRLSELCVKAPSLSASYDTYFRRGPAHYTGLWRLNYGFQTSSFYHGLPALVLGGLFRRDPRARRSHSFCHDARSPGQERQKCRPIFIALARRESLPIFTLECDVTSDASCRTPPSVPPIAQAGRIDVAINNAGYGLMGLAEAVTTQQAQQIMDTNFMGCVRVNRAVASPHAPSPERLADAHQQWAQGASSSPPSPSTPPANSPWRPWRKTYRYEHRHPGHRIRGRGTGRVSNACVR